MPDLDDTRVRRDISLESIDLTTGERTTLTTAAWPNDEDAVSADGSTIAFNEIGTEDSPGHVVQQLAVVARPAVNQRVDLPVGDSGAYTTSAWTGRGYSGRRRWKTPGLGP